MTYKNYNVLGIPHASRADIGDLRRTPAYVPQSLLHHVSHLCGTAWLREPQEMMLRKERETHGIERICGEENHALAHVGRFGLQQMIQVLPVEGRQAPTEGEPV
jgi:hypothetical protein